MTSTTQTFSKTGGETIVKDLPPTSWTLLTGLPAAALGSGTATPHLGVADFIGPGIKWKTSAVTTDRIVTQVPLGNQVGLISKMNSWNLKLRALVRKLDVTGSATEDAALGIRCRVRWLSARPGAGLSGTTEDIRSTNPIDVLLPAKAIAANATGVAWLTFDIGKAMSDYNVSVLPWTVLSIELGPNKTVPADLTIELAGAQLLCSGDYSGVNTATVGS
jgi:hypothetical protein